MNNETLVTLLCAVLIFIVPPLISIANSIIQEERVFLGGVATKIAVVMVILAIEVWVAAVVVLLAVEVWR